MNYTLEAIVLIVIVLLLVYSQQLLQFLNLISLKFKTSTPTIIAPNRVDRDILIEIAKLEKFLYKERFTRRIIIKDYTSIKDPNRVCYKFYYYQLIDGIHAYIETKGKINNKIEFNFYFETHYDSKNITLTTNSEQYLLDSVPENIYLYKKDNLSIQKLLKAHLLDRKIANEAIYKKRLYENSLINQTIEQEQEHLRELIKNGYIKYTDYGFKLLPTFKLFRGANRYYKFIGINRGSTKAFMQLLGIYIVIAMLFFITFLFLQRYTTTDRSTKTLDTKTELQKFKEQVQSYKGLTIELSSKNSYSLKESMKSLDSYLKQSNIKRYIGKPLKDINQTSLPCKLPNDLIAIYKWHNGIEQLIPNRDLFKYTDFKNSYLNFKDKLQYNNSSSLVFLFANGEKYRGLALDCSQSGVYEYALSSKGIGKKEFYNINHFLKITAEAYKNRAFYDDYDTIKIDLKKFFKIYRKYLSRSDTHRYKLLTKYLKQKAIDYISASQKLKIELLNEIANSYDPELTNSAKLYLNDANTEVAAKAIYALGSVGSKSTLPTLIKLLKSKNQQFRDFALLSIAKIVDSKDEGLLEYIYPMLNDKSILVKLSAYKVIEKIGSKNSLIVLREYFKHEKPAIKLEIIKIFAKIGGNEEFKLLKEYLKEVNKMDFSGEIKDIARGDNPHPKILQYETIRAITEIASRATQP